jgi:hypothetical protein
MEPKEYSTVCRDAPVEQVIVSECDISHSMLHALHPGIDARRDGSEAVQNEIIVVLARLDENARVASPSSPASTLIRTVYHAHSK